MGCDRVTAVVLNWRAPTEAAEAAEALLDSDGIALDVLVVDNGSGDGSAESLRRRLGRDRVVALPDNRGYAGGMNAGLERALAGGADAVLLVTQDTLLAPDTVAGLARALDADAGLGVVGPVVYYRDGGERVFSAGKTLVPALARSRVLHDGGDAGPYDVDAIDGCCMLIRRQTAEVVGGFDPRYFMYFEETDYCLRARRAGWRVAVVPQVGAWQAKPDVPAPHYFYYMTRNSYLFWSRGYGLSGWRVAAANVAVTAELGAWALLALVAPWRWAELPTRFRRTARQVIGLVRGTQDHLRGRYGAQL